MPWCNTHFPRLRVGLVLNRPAAWTEFGYAIFMRHPSCTPADHPAIGRRELLQAGGIGFLGTGLADLLRLEAQAAEGAGIAPGRSRWSSSSSRAARRSTRRSTPSPTPPTASAANTARRRRRCPASASASTCRGWRRGPTSSRIVRTMHHPADRQFRNEHNSCHYLLHTGTTELPAGRHQRHRSPRRGRAASSGRRIGSMIAYAAPPRPEVGLPAVVEIPRGNLMTLSRPRPGHARAAVRPLGRRSGRAVQRHDAGGSCPNCFSHDDPNDPARAAGPGPEGLVGQHQLPQPDFHLPDLGAVQASRFRSSTNRTALLAQLDRLRAAGRCRARPCRVDSLGRPSPAGHAAAARPRGRASRTRST